MRLTIGETSRLTGVSVRTLHYYDEIGLLKPSDTSEAGYRYYDEASLSVLQQILFYRELEFPLKEIGRILSQPDYDQKRALTGHRELLLLKRRHMDDLLRLVDGTLGGQENMDKNTFLFADVEEAKARYAEEAKARWGHTDAWKVYAAREETRTESEKAEMLGEANAVFKAFAGIRNGDPSDPEALALAVRWQALISRSWYDCTDDILEGLAELYVSDGRFTKNLDRFGDGTALFMSRAIKAYCQKRRDKQ